MYKLVFIGQVVDFGYNSSGIVLKGKAVILRQAQDDYLCLRSEE